MYKREDEMDIGDWGEVEAGEMRFDGIDCDGVRWFYSERDYLEQAPRVGVLARLSAWFQKNFLRAEL